MTHAPWWDIAAVAAIGRGAEAMHGAPFTIGTRRSTR